MAPAKTREGKRNKAGPDEGKIRIQWYRSTIGANSRHKELVRSLGLTKLNQIVERPDTPSTRGVVAKAPHLLRIVD
jgi:large subunit ribosomal protein L30